MNLVHRPLRCLPAALIVVLICGGTPDWPARAADSFTLTEHFGVSHPDQIITFDLATPVDPAKTAVYSGNVEVPYQLLDGGKQLAVRTGLAADETKAFTLRADTPKAADPAAVAVKETADGYEISNTLSGIRVPKPTDSLPFPAPVQGVRLRDATWTPGKATLAVTPPEKAAAREPARGRRGAASRGA